MCTPHSGSNLTVDGRDGSRETSPLETLTTGVVTLVVMGVAFGALALGNPWFWIAFPIGFGGLLPLSLEFVRRWEPRGENRTRRIIRTDSDGSALSVLRDRYVRGHIDEREFETRVEVLLETESATSANASIDRSSPETQR